jgi:uncharacterized protein
LKTVLKERLEGVLFSTSLDNRVNNTDTEVMAAVLEATRDDPSAGHGSARRVLRRDHYRTLYRRNPTPIGIIPDSAPAIAKAASCQYVDCFVHHDSHREKNRTLDLPVLMRDGRIVSRSGYI